jgi:N,N'-diacetyllegionaminate synthase
MIIKNKILIIAEAGVNHNGILQNAFKLIDLIVLINNFKIL